MKWLHCADQQVASLRRSTIGSIAPISNSEIRAKVFKELLDELNAENPGFSDLFGGGREPTFVPAEGEEEETPE